MKHSVTILARAARDVDEIYLWIAERSLQGAQHWNDAFLAATEVLEINPDRHALAPESGTLRREIRELHFKTNAGRRYRLLFFIAEHQVRILCVRGPGQPPVTEDDLR